MAAIFFFWEPLIVTKIRKVIGASWTDGKLFASERALYFQDYNFFTASGWKFAKELSSKLDGWKRFSRKVIFSANPKRNYVLTRVKNSRETRFLFYARNMENSTESFEPSFPSNKNYEIRIKFVRKIVSMFIKTFWRWCILLCMLLCYNKI